MKYLCLGYLDRVEMDSRPKTEIDGIMAECWPHMETLYKTGSVVVAPIILGRGVTHVFFEKR